jgi:Raf kinase inhibitor-like YbhB/YbcL family protein
MTLAISSPAFAPHEAIPLAHTIDGANISPPLHWTGLPARATALALIMHDPDAPAGDFVHWVMFNIPATLGHLPEGAQHRGDFADGIVQGCNSLNRVGYDGPMLPPGKAHRCVFDLFALDEPLRLHSGATRDDLMIAIQGHVLDAAELVCSSQRQ